MTHYNWSSEKTFSHQKPINVISLICWHVSFSFATLVLNKNSANWNGYENVFVFWDWDFLHSWFSKSNWRILIDLLLKKLFLIKNQLMSVLWIANTFLSVSQLQVWIKMVMKIVLTFETEIFYAVNCFPVKTVFVTMVTDSLMTNNWIWNGRDSAIFYYW